MIFILNGCLVVIRVIVLRAIFSVRVFGSFGIMTVNLNVVIGLIFFFIIFLTWFKIFLVDLEIFD